ncbi:putative serine/threonine-protein kinase PBL22 [Bidens hawaiensis]|uniref:putative serine/threonine-protein kinase PBL22 n=1 Tax=Bidens hawaiensis TaxID=980011 RepID=UPI00404B2190
MSENPEEKLHSLTTEDAFHRFSLADIHLATQNFNDALVIGKGGFGTVYKGRIHGTRDATERLVAIKRLDSSSTQGAPEFMNEIKMLTKVHHCNLVSLIGYCFDNNEMILVYEYMPNGTIDYHLHKADTRLSWMHRLKISIGVARGLHYLHTGVGTQHGIIHRDLKSSNILLDENWAARISDFGMSKVVDHPSSGVITTPKGTFGYLDHEYCRTGKLTRKSDVYAFGLFLIELLSGRRAIDPLFVDEGHNVADWAKKCVKEGQLEQVVCSHITKQISPKCLKEFVHIADLCTKSSRKERPTMAEVVYTLDQLMALQKNFDSSGSRHNSDSLRIFSYSDMEVATKNFSSHRLLGRGHYGEVIRGWLDKKTHSSYIHDNGLSIAVKRLYRHKFKSHMVNEMKMESLEEFNDPNVVKILGYCVEEYSVLIIYEFMHQGNLKDYLFSVKRRTEKHLFASRVKIAIGVARGLLF